MLSFPFLPLRIRGHYYMKKRDSLSGYKSSYSVRELRNGLVNEFSFHEDKILFIRLILILSTYV